MWAGPKRMEEEHSIVVVVMVEHTKNIRIYIINNNNAAHSETESAHRSVKNNTLNKKIVAPWASPGRLIILKFWLANEEPPPLGRSALIGHSGLQWLPTDRKSYGWVNI